MKNFGLRPKSELTNFSVEILTKQTTLIKWLRLLYNTILPPDLFVVVMLQDLFESFKFQEDWFCFVLFSRTTTPKVERVDPEGPLPLAS